jgi:hypothetical protein
VGDMEGMTTLPPRLAQAVLRLACLVEPDRLAEVVEDWVELLTELVPSKRGAHTEIHHDWPPGGGRGHLELVTKRKY